MSSDLYVMQSECNADAASHLSCPVFLLSVQHSTQLSHFTTTQLDALLREHHLDSDHDVIVGTSLFRQYAAEVPERRISGWAAHLELRAAGQAGFRHNHCMTTKTIRHVCNHARQ